MSNPIYSFVCFPLHHYKEYHPAVKILKNYAVDFIFNPLRWNILQLARHLLNNVTWALGSTPQYLRFLHSILLPNPINFHNLVNGSPPLFTII